MRFGTIGAGAVALAFGREAHALVSGEPVTITPLDLIAKRVVVKGFFLNHPDVELNIPSALRDTAPLVASGDSSTYRRDLPAHRLPRSRRPEPARRQGDV